VQASEARDQIATEVSNTIKMGETNSWPMGSWEKAAAGLRNIVNVRISLIVDYVNAFRSDKCLKDKQAICAKNPADSCPAPCASERFLLVGPKRCVFPDRLAKRLSTYNGALQACPYAPSRK